MGEQQPSLTSFLKWAAQLGVSDSPFSSSSSSVSPSCLGYSLCISDFPEAGGRGLAAVRELKKGELILRVSKSALMTSDSVLAKDQKLAHAFKYHSLSSTQVLTVCLLAEMNKGRRSAWYPYLLQLPRSYDILASFSPFQAKALQVDDAVWVTEKVILKAESDWREAIALLEQLELKPQFVTFKAWLWASATISSRTLHISWDSAGCLCPVGDLFNYAAPGEDLVSSEVSENWTDDSFLQVRSLQSGDDTEDPLYAEQCGVCSSRLIDGGYEDDVAAYCFYAKKNYRTDSLYIQHDGKPSFSLLSALRLWATPPNQRKSFRYLALSGSQLSPENEFAVMKWLISKCQAILNSLPSTIDDDKSLLGTIDNAQRLEFVEKPNKLSFAASSEFCKFLESMELCHAASEAVSALSSNVKRSMERWKLAVQWRLRYKQMLVDCISFCSLTMESLFPGNGANRRTILD